MDIELEAVRLKITTAKAIIDSPSSKTTTSLGPPETYEGAGPTRAIEMEDSVALNLLHAFAATFTVSH